MPGIWLAPSGDLSYRSTAGAGAWLMKREGEGMDQKIPRTEQDARITLGGT